MTRRPVHTGGGKATVIDAATLYHGDCLDLLPAIVARYGPFDHVIADPPYEDALHRAAAALVAASKGWVLAFSLAEGVGVWEAALTAAGAKWDTTLAWVKPDAAPRSDGQGAARGFECICTAWAGSGHRRWNGGGRRGVLTHLTAKGGDKTAKPADLMMELVALYTRPGEIVCDPFMGSGTTGVAALRLGRRFIGIEKDERHFATACARIAAIDAAPFLPFTPSDADVVQARLELETDP